MKTLPGLGFCDSISISKLEEMKVTFLGTRIDVELSAEVPFREISTAANPPSNMSIVVGVSFAETKPIGRIDNSKIPTIKGAVKKRVSLPMYAIG